MNESPIVTNTCDYEITDGNREDPSYAYCGLPPSHAGPHGEWIY